jgi:nitrate reductase gamma subunit
MSAGDVLLWIIFPYVAITVFVVGHWWRYRRDQFNWTSRSAIPGAIAGAVTLIGFIGLVYRRASSDRVRRTTTRTDYVTYLLLTVLILMGCYMTFARNLLTDDPYNYRESISIWWQSLFYLDPNVAAAARAPLIYQLHAIIAWAFWASFPFSRLVHAWSIPLQYGGRPYILYRRRYSAAS